MPSRVAAAWGADTVLPSEFLDLYGMSSPRVQSAVFPIIDPEFYRDSANLADPDENLLDHFLHHGIHLEIDPHPLISFDWMRFSRPDIFERPLTAAIFFSIFESNLISTSPFFDIAFYRRETAGSVGLKSAFLDFVFRGASKGLSTSRWIDLDHYRETYPDVPRDSMEALLHFIQMGDGDLRSPCPDFDPIWYQETYSTNAHPIDHPLHHYLRWGRFARHAPRPDKAAEPQRGGNRLRAQTATGGFSYIAEPDRLQDSYRRVRSSTVSALARRVQGRRDGELGGIPDGPAGELDRQSEGITLPQASSPAIEVIVHSANKLVPAMRTLRSLEAVSSELSGLDIEDRQGIAVTVLAEQSDAGTDTADQLENRINGFKVLRRPLGAPMKTEAAAVLFLSAGAEIDAASLSRLVRKLGEDSSRVATAPLVLSAKDKLISAGGLVRADGTARLIGQGMSVDDCPWTRARDVHWAPLSALLVKRSALDQAEDAVWANLHDGDAVGFSMQLRQGNGKIRLVASARVHARAAGSMGSADAGKAHEVLEQYGQQIEKDLQLQVIAHYFPHFGADDLVERFNGQGASDWFVVSKAQSCFVGHYQPHVPRDLGFYDNRVSDLPGQQVAMAGRYGIDGFLLRYYNLTGQRVYGRTFEQMVAGQYSGVQHALCWETRGLENIIDPIEKGVVPPHQEFTQPVVDAVLADAIAAAETNGCIRVAGLPLFVVSDVDRLPDAHAFAAQARAAFVAAGFAGVHLAMLGPGFESQSFGMTAEQFGFDSLVQNAPHGLDVPEAKRAAKTFQATNIALQDYRDAASSAFQSSARSQIEFPGLCVGWDDTPRRRLSHRVLLNQTPAAFQAWLQTTIDRLDLGALGSERKIFVNAWNNWACGAHLEPDNEFGRDWLNSVSQARHRALAPVTETVETRRQRISGKKDSLAILIHAYYLDVFEEMIEMMVAEDLPYHLYVTCPEQNVDGAQEAMNKAGIAGTILPSENHGRDVFPFLTHVHQIQLDGHKYLLKLHTKKSLHRTDGDMWRKELFGPFLNRKNLERLVMAFDASPDYGMAGPETHILPLSDHLEENRQHLSAICERLGVEYQDALERDQFVAGTMFFARFSTLIPILKLGLERDDFEDEGGQVDGTIAHALERALGLACRLNGREVVPLERALGTRRASRRGERRFHG